MPDPVRSWTDLIPYGVSFGLGTLGNRIATGPARANNEWERQQYEQERQRRNMLQSFAAPSMLRALGHQPEQINQMTRQIGGSAPIGSSTGNTAVPQTPQSGASKALGAVGTGLGMAGMAGNLGLLGSLVPATKVGLGVTGTAAGAGGVPGALGLGGGAGLLGLGAATIPVLGGLIAGGAYAANKIGQGRRTANKATGGGGFEDQFRQVLERAAAGQAGLQELQQARQAYEQAAQAWIGAGGRQRTVAEQSLSNEPLHQTYQTLIRQYGG